MDNKITKTRLVDFLSYEWILMIIVAVLSIIGWNLIYTVTGVSLTKGQQFMLTYDEGIDNNFGGEFITLAAQDGRFCYDILEVGVEQIHTSGETNLLSIRYNTRDIDVFITDDAELEDTTTRFRTIIDGYIPWSFDGMLKDGKDYLKKFLKQGVNFDADQTVVYDFNNLDQAKIESYFAKRQKGDNRFRDEQEKQKGIKGEKERLQKLCKELKTLDYLLTEHQDIFVKYKRYAQTFRLYPDDKELEERISYETEQFYALKLGALTDGEYQPGDFFTKDGSHKTLVVMCFNFLLDQPDLQYENISIINFMVKTFSNRLDGFTA